MPREVDPKRTRKAKRIVRKLAAMEAPDPETGEIKAAESYSDWERTFLGEVEGRLDKYGSAFHNLSKGRAEEALSSLQHVKLREIAAKARGKPRKPLRAKTTYTAKMSAEADAQPWSAEWSFTTFDPRVQEARTAEYLRDAVNAVRKWAGLEPVTLDEKLSQDCRLHANYVVRNLEHPKVQGLGIHDQDMTLPGATAAGASPYRRANNPPSTLR